MSVIICLCALGIIFPIMWKISKQLWSNHDSDGEQHVSAAEEPEAVKGNAFKIMKKALKKIGCQPNVLSADSMEVAYQGENFAIKCDGSFARIWDLGWSHINMNDPNFSSVVTATNNANFHPGPTVVIARADDEEDMIELHSRMDIMLHSSLSVSAGYVRYVLESFFQTKQNVKDEYRQLYVKQSQSRQKRPKVGFCTSPDDDNKTSPEQSTTVAETV